MSWIVVAKSGDDCLQLSPGVVFVGVIVNGVMGDKPELLLERRNRLLFVEAGVCEPDVGLEARCLTCETARRSRLVVPSAFVDPDRAEKTSASLCWWV